ncbi:MAG: GntR family transcriptional regulator [Amaricoccus sp.]
MDSRADQIQSVDEDEIVSRIYDAVIEQRLPPGTKLAESALCEAFGVGRARVRRSLLLLASREIVELQANRGAFVARPTARQARDVFEARRAIEPTILRLAAARASADDLDRLESHLAAEARAHRQHNRPLAVRLSGEFHVVLGAIAGNGVLERMARQLVTRTSLILGLFGAAGTDVCRSGEHGQLLAAIRRRDPGTAEALMLEHLARIEAGLDLSLGTAEEISLVALFSPERDQAG